MTGKRTNTQTTPHNDLHDVVLKVYPDSDRYFNMEIIIYCGRYEDSDAHLQFQISQGQLFNHKQVNIRIPIDPIFIVALQ